MIRLLSAAALIAAAWLITASTACDADTTQGCLGGSCPGLDGGGTGGSDASTTCDSTPKTGEIPCEVFAVIHAKCNPCHNTPTQNGAPFPLLTYADTQEPYGTDRLVYQQMFDQIQPGASPRMPLNGMLTDAEMKTLGDWLAACAPPAAAGTGCGCPGNGCD